MNRLLMPREQLAMEQLTSVAADSEARHVLSKPRARRPQ